MLSRRTILHTLAATALALSTAGCSAFGSTARGATDVFIENRTDASATVSLTVTYADGNSAIDKTLTVGPGEEAKINNEVVMETDSTVDVQVADGPNGTYDWRDAVEPLYVTIMDDEITFEEKP